RLVPARAVHERVDDERVLVAEQLGEFHRRSQFFVAAAAGPLERVILFQRAAARQLAALFRQPLGAIDQLLLVLEQLFTRGTIFLAVIRDGLAGFGHDFLLRRGFARKTAL